ncbi:MAG: LamG domain-containing protein [Chitinophagaceae bacterium]|nr:LamG domain-containing protein [Chitinophagaceae bacterium]
MKRILILLLYVISNILVAGAQVPTNGLVAYYPFNGNANDESGNSKHGTGNNVVSVVDRFGVAGKAYQFDGTSWISVADHPDFDFTSSLTFSLWVWFDQHNPPYGYRLIDKQTPGSPDGYTFDTQGDGSGSNMRFCPGPCEVNGVAKSFIPTQQWVNLSVTYNSGIARFYVNGRFVHEGHVSATIPINEFPLTFGKTAINSESYAEYNFKGRLDDIRIYNRALASDEITQLYNSEVPVIDLRNGLLAHYPMDGNTNDVSGNMNHGVLKGPKPSRDKAGEFGKAYSFDGIDDEIYVDPSKLPSSMSAITISGWFKPKAYSVTNSNWIPILERSNGTENGMFVLALSESNNALYANLQDKFYYAIKPNNVQLNEWHFIAVSISQDKQFFFLDGEFYGVTGVTQNQYDPNQPLIIGRTPAGNNEIYNGDLDEIRIYNRALSFTEIELLYRRGNTECTSPTPQIISSQVSAETNIEGKLPIAANVESCPTSNPIVQFKYWFDGDDSKARLLETPQSGYLNYVKEISCVELPEGQHTIAFQFKALDETWSEVITKTFSRQPITNQIVTGLRISVNPGNVIAGETIRIKGIGFSPNGRARVVFYDIPPLPDVFNRTVNVDSKGEFEIEESVPDDLSEKVYAIGAEDIETSQNAASFLIWVKSEIQGVPQGIKLLAPTSASEQKIGSSISLSWYDPGFLLSGIRILPPPPINGAARYSYRIEMSYNDNSWIPIKTIEGERNAIDREKQVFTHDYIPTALGTYKFKVVDVSDQSRYIESPLITIVADEVKPFTTLFHWANGVNYHTNIPIKGIVADGTARFLIEVITNEPANSVTLELFNNKGTNDKTFLGKVMAANITAKSGYSEEANAAVSISASQTQSANDEKKKWYFWYVAPDDFVQPGDDRELGERTVDFWVRIDSRTPVRGRPIQIVRPPLMMVHGLGGDAIETWKHTRFNGKSGQIYFNSAFQIFKAGVFRPTMHATDCFIKNAKRLLNIDDNDCSPVTLPQREIITENSIIRAIANSIANGYACSRVDYVCHSMGGVMLRSAINGYHSTYYAGEQSPAYFKNYGKGYVNKLITINTPHWGSPWADMAKDIVEKANASENKLWKTENYVAFSNMINSPDNYFIRRTKDLGGYEVNPAIENLQAIDGGITLNETNIRNHVIYGKLGEIGGQNTGAALFLFQPALKNIVKLHEDYVNPEEVPGYQTNSMEALVFAQNVNRIFRKNYGIIGDFVENSDLIVSLQSQTSGDLSRPQNSHTKFEGIAARHTGTEERFGILFESIVSNDKVGDRVLDVLNSPINSDVFADKLDANPNTRGASRLGKVTSSGGAQQNGAVVLGDSKVQIATPLSNDMFSGDTLLPVHVTVSDTIGLRHVRLFFQGDFYYSSFKTFNHTFRLPIRPRVDEREMIYLTGVYDSAGITIYHTDTVGIVVATKPTLAGISAFLDRSYISKGDTIIPFVDAITSEGVIRLNREDTAIAIRVLDTTIAKVTSSGSRIAVHSRTGSTRAIIAYQGFEDTIILAHNDFYNLTESPAYCPGSGISLIAGFNGSVNRRWQIDSAADFIDLSNGNGLEGVTSDTLVISNSDSTLFGRKFRCIASAGSNEFISQTFTIRFVSKWLGAVSSDWNEAANWSCGNAPQYFSDVVITSGAKFMPKVNASVSLNSLEIEEGANIQIEASAKITLLSKQFD